jgi:hypothetical protein
MVMFVPLCIDGKVEEESIGDYNAFEKQDYIGGEGGGRTHTLSEQRQILSLVRLPVPPLRRG